MQVRHNLIRKYTPQYYKDLENYAKFHADTESTTEMAFKSLLKSVGDASKCVLLKNYETLVNGKQIVPDGIIRGEYGRYIGYWEAKDTDDKLDDEIYKKLKKGYPRANTIFEDTQTAVLYQDEVEYDTRFNLSNEEELT